MRLFVVFFAFLLTLGTASADYVALYWENDLLTLDNEDRWYTDGWRATYGIGDTRTVMVGQNMYTPSDISVELETPIGNDRPYAGWLYVGYGQWWDKPMDLPFGRLYTEVLAGPVGEYSFAEETQKWIHERFENQEPMGWASQIEDDFGIQTYNKYQVNARIMWPWLGADAHVGVSAGNIKMGAEAGFTVKAGSGIAGSLAFDRITIKDIKPPRFIYASVIPQYVLDDAFLPSYYQEDGTTLEGPGHKEFVTDFIVGINWGFKSGFDMTYQWTYRTEQFEAQTQPSEFGAVGMRYRF